MEVDGYRQTERSIDSQIAMLDRQNRIDTIDEINRCCVMEIDDRQIERQLCHGDRQIDRKTAIDSCVMEIDRQINRWTEIDAVLWRQIGRQIDRQIDVVLWIDKQIRQIHRQKLIVVLRKQK